MSQLQLLRAATSLHDVAGLLQFTPKAVAFILYKKAPATKYKSFKIAKRGGGVREINAPCPELMLLQRRLSDLLLNCIDEINAKRQREDQLAHGFKRHRSIITNARKHKKRKFVFKIDLQDFFPTINFGRVRGFFIKDANFMLHPDVATVLAQIACHNNGLPQGSPCSPVISNLIGNVLDIHLCKLASANGCSYSRYADDITFSTNKPDFPAGIAKPVQGQPHRWEVGDRLREVIAHAGFSMNPQKTRMQYRESRQVVTGLVVNAKVNVRSEYRRTVRAMAQHLFETGKFETMQCVPDANGILTPTKAAGTIPQLHGMLGHINAVDRHNAEIAANHIGKNSASVALRSKEKVYRRFLMYKDFYAAQVPVILCEGKTDPTYLWNAIKRLAGHYPKLATVEAGAKVTLNVRLYNTQSHSGRLLQLGRGASDLERFIGDYLSELKGFKAPSGLQQAIVLVVDNDGGADTIFSKISGIAKKKALRTDPYIHISANLYLVPTPLERGATKSAIEDCFPDSVKKVKIGGKTFSTQSKADPALYFGKAIFAEYVRTHASKIDFSGFATLLNNITVAIEAHQTKCAAAAQDAAKPVATSS